MFYHLISIFFYFNFHLSFIPVLWTYWVSNQLGLSQSTSYYIFLFASSQIVYVYDRILYTDLADSINVPDRVRFITSSKRTGMYWFFLNFLFVILTFTSLTIENGILFFILTIFTLFYLFVLKKIFITEILKAYLKIFILSVVWSTILILSPIAQNIQLIHFKNSLYLFFSIDIDKLYQYDLYFIFINFIYVNIIFHLSALYFDRRDKVGDLQTNKPNIHKFISERLFNIIKVIIPLILIILNLYFYQIDMYFYIGLYYFCLAIISYYYKIFPNNLNYDINIDFPIVLFPLIDLMFRFL